MRILPAITGIFFAGFLTQAAFADDGIQMLPPTLSGSATPCDMSGVNANNNNVLTFNGNPGAPESGGSAINCNSNIFAAPNGQLQAKWFQANGTAQAGADIANTVVLDEDGVGSGNPAGRILLLGPDNSARSSFIIQSNSANGSLGSVPFMITPNGTGDSVGIDLPVGDGPSAALDVYGVGTDISTPTSWGKMIFRASDSNWRPAIAVYGDIDGTLLVDNTQGALAVRDVSGTGRSITTSGSIAVNGGGAVPPSYFLGSVGIGTASPQAMLDVNGEVKSTWLAATGPASVATASTAILDVDGNAARILAFGPNNSTRGAFIIQTATPNGSLGTAPFLIVPNGGGDEIGVNLPIGQGPSYTLHVNGTVYATGAAGSLSDRRHKKDIEPYAGDALAQVGQLKPVTFLWKDPTDAGMQGKQIGFIAQDVQQVVPDAVMTMDNDEKTLSLKYDALIPVLVKSIQQLKDDNDNLRSEVEQLKAGMKTAH